MADAEGYETDYSNEESKILHTFDRVGIMKRNVHDARDVAREQRDGNGYVEQDVHQRTACVEGKGLEQQIDGKSNEEIGEFISMHGTSHPFA